MKKIVLQTKNFLCSLSLPTFFTISLDRQSLPLNFVITLLALFSLPIFAPQWHLAVIAPFLIVSYYQKPFIFSLWASLFCGLLLDLLSSQLPIGFHALAFCVTTLILYPQRRHFFADNLTTLPIMTYLFSTLSTAIQAGLHTILERPISFSWTWVFSELISMPALDSLYSFLIFIFLPFLFEKRQRHANEYFAERNVPLYRDKN